MKEILQETGGGFVSVLQSKIFSFTSKKKDKFNFTSKISEYWLPVKVSSIGEKDGEKLSRLPTNLIRITKAH